MDTKLVDLFFTIHANRRGTLLFECLIDLDDPLYISEQVFETMVPKHTMWEADVESEF